MVVLKVDDSAMTMVAMKVVSLADEMVGQLNTAMAVMLAVYLVV